MNVSIKIEGLDEFIEGLGNFDQKARDRIVRNAARAGATEVQRAVKKAAPIDMGRRSKQSRLYGHLRENIRVKQIGRLPYYKVTTGNAFWGMYLNRGTKFIKPSRWFDNAVDTVRESVVAKMIDNIRKSIVRELAKI